MNRDSLAPERRSFLSRLNAGLASFAAMAGVAMAQQTQAPSAAARWEPARHAKDDWMDRPGDKHRLVFDTTSMEGVGNAMAFAGNFFRVNKTDYGVDNDQVGIIIVLRHRSAVFGYNDAMWAKYGATLAARSKAEDPKTGKAPTVNLFNAGGNGGDGPNRGTLDALAKLGTTFGVCALSTRAIAGSIARSVGSTQDAIFAELGNNLVGNARLVPAGIVAVSRAQEHGYTLVTC